ncbi:Troponin C [Hypsibius exemplaris]|uniref:Troponin C n=1 Tax=Hypsibius exemplaris TaxID=2072580 RepID=A0A1W0WPQ6_HYPEX|nr:Troponin C [Hypsibius exemplaris]
MGEELTEEQKVAFKKAFNMFDKEKQGFIHTRQIGSLLRTMGQAFEDKDLRELIAEVDTDGSGEIEFDEFLVLVSRFVVEGDKAKMEQELRDAFRLYDKQGNGYINVSDLREILRALEDKITEEELDEMIAEIDTDGSGTVDFDEFMEMMTAG